MHCKISIRIILALIIIAANIAKISKSRLQEIAGESKMPNLKGDIKKLEKGKGVLELTLTGGMIDNEGANIPVFLAKVMTECVSKAKNDKKDEIAASMAIYWHTIKLYVKIVRICNFSSLESVSMEMLQDLQSKAAAAFVLFDSVFQKKSPPYIFRVMVILVMALMEQKLFCPKGIFLILNGTVLFFCCKCVLFVQACIV